MLTGTAAPSIARFPPIATCWGPFRNVISLSGLQAFAWRKRGGGNLMRCITDDGHPLTVPDRRNPLLSRDLDRNQPGVEKLDERYAGEDVDARHDAIDALCLRSRIPRGLRQRHLAAEVFKDEPGDRRVLPVHGEAVAPRDPGHRRRDAVDAGEASFHICFCMVKSSPP